MEAKRKREKGQGDMSLFDMEYSHEKLNKIKQTKAL